MRISLRIVGDELEYTSSLYIDSHCDLSNVEANRQIEQLEVLGR